MGEPRHAADAELGIPGWDVYTRPEGYRAVCCGDRSLVVEHLDFGTLSLACAAITTPPDEAPPLQPWWPHPGPGAGINA